MKLIISSLLVTGLVAAIGTFYFINPPQENISINSPGANNSDTSSEKVWPKFPTALEVAVNYCTENKLDCTIKKLYEDTVVYTDDFLNGTWHGAIFDLGVDNVWLIASEWDDIWGLSMTTVEGCETGTDQPNLVDYCPSLDEQETDTEEDLLKPVTANDYVVTDAELRQLKLMKQAQAVYDIRTALALWKSQEGTYPTSLSSLSNWSLVKGHFPESLEDEFTNQPYIYLLTTDDYALRYYMNLSFPVDQVTYASGYRNGWNTATKDYLSRELERPQY